MTSPGHMHPPHRHHCTGGPLLSPRETTCLIDTLIDDDRHYLQTKRTQMTPDWDDITARFNAKFGTPNRSRGEIFCFIELCYHEFWTEFFKKYDKRIKPLLREMGWAGLV